MQYFHNSAHQMFSQLDSKTFLMLLDQTPYKLKSSDWKRVSAMFKLTWLSGDLFN